VASIRPTTADDLPALRRLYPEAFPDEPLMPLVEALFSEVPDLLSRAVDEGGELVGHILFTPCSVPGSSVNIALLGPMAVAPAHQRAGLGTALIRQGLSELREQGFTQVQVLGDPGFYGRVGFEEDRAVQPPCPLNPDWEGAWQCLRLDPGSPVAAGLLHVPRPWQDPALWC
jgi:putative acetyltransferase